MNYACQDAPRSGAGGAGSAALAVDINALMESAQLCFDATTRLTLEVNRKLQDPKP